MAFQKFFQKVRANTSSFGWPQSQLIICNFHQTPRQSEMGVDIALFTASCFICIFAIFLFRSQLISFENNFINSDPDDFYTKSVKTTALQERLTHSDRLHLKVDSIRTRNSGRFFFPTSVYIYETDSVLSDTLH